MKAAALKYGKCPKCGHAAADGTTLENECPACGVLFRKLFAASAVALTREQPEH